MSLIWDDTAKKWVEKNQIKKTPKKQTLPKAKQVYDYDNKEWKTISTATPKKKQEDSKWYQQILKGSDAFDDGYQFGDITKTALGTAGDIASTAAKATWENIYDIGMNVAGANYWLLDKTGIMPGAYDAFTDIERYNQDVAVVSDIDKGVDKLNKATRDNSVLGDFSKDTLQSAIQSAENALISKASGLPIWQANSLATGYRNEYVNALKNGATKEQASISGLTSGISEVLTEYLFSGFIKLPGTGSGIDTALGKATEKIGNKFLRTVAQYGINVGGEAFEEVLSGFGSALGQSLTYLKDDIESGKIKFKDIYSLEDALENAGAGALSAMFGSANPQTIQNIRDGRNLVTGLTSTQQKYIDEIAQQRMVEAEKRNAKLNLIQKGKINQRTMTDFEKGRLADASKLNLLGLSTKDMDLQQSAYKYGINPNSEAVVEMKTLFDNRDIVGIFDADRFKGSNENAFWSRNENGKREVVLNPNASTDVLLEEIAIHELTHDLMSSENSQEIIDNQKIMDYVSTLDGYEEARKAVEKKYKRETDKLETAEEKVAYINEEIVADTLGKNIGSQEYIRRLIDDEPSVAKKIYDWVVNKVTNSKGVKNEKAYWNNVKNNFEKAYNMEYQIKGKQSDTRLSIGGEKGFNNLTDSEKKSVKWYQDKNGDWKFEFSDSEMNLLEDLDDIKPGKEYTINELFNHKLLTKMYPDLQEYKIVFENLGTANGKHNFDEKIIRVNTSKLNYKNLSKNEVINAKKFGMNNYEYAKTQVESILLHEIQHAIQKLEGFETGRGTKYFKKAYLESLGEIEANDTKLRYILERGGKLDRNKIAPESSKSNPVHKDINGKSNLEYYLKNRSNIRKILDNLYDKYGTQIDKFMEKAYNFLNKEGMSNEEIDLLVEEYQKEVLQKDSENNIQNVVRRRPTLNGTSDSSFSMSKQLENQASNLVEEDIQTTKAMLDNFKSYLEEYDITNPTQEDIDNSLIDLLSYDNDMTPAETLKYEKQYKEVVNEYLKEQKQDIRYSLSESNTNLDTLLKDNNLSLRKNGSLEYKNLNEKQINQLVKIYQKNGYSDVSTDYMKESINSGRAFIPREVADEFIKKALKYTPNYDTTQIYEDAEGNQLTKEQVEFYKNSDVRDIRGRLIPVYHRTDSEFTVFDKKAGTKHGKKYGQGFYFSITPENYGNNEMKVYLNAKEGEYKYVSSQGYYIVQEPNQIKNVDNTNPTEDADIRFAKQNALPLDKNFKPKGTKTRLSDIKLPGVTKVVQEEVQKQTSNALLPIANELKELNKNLNKVLNPSEIAQLTPQDADTTPILPGITRNKVGDGKSKFFDNIKDKTNMLSDETKTAILSSDDVKYYDKVTNKESLDKAYARLQKNGRAEVEDWLNKTKQTDGKDARQVTSVDVAEGWILLKQTNDAIEKETDPIRKHQLLQSSVTYAINLRDIGSKAGQVIQAFNILSRLTPEGMVYYAQKELSQAYDEMVQNKTKAWIDENKSKFELQPNEVQFILDTMKDVSTMEDGRAKDIKLAQIQAMMKDKLPPSKGAGIRAWMRISMLFNPKTLITRNPLGNALMVPVNAVGDVFASGVDKLISKKTGVRTKGNMNVQSYGKGFVKGAKNATQDYLMGINTRNIEGNRFELTEGKSFNDNNIIGKGLNKADNMLGYVLDIGDRTFYEGSFENSLKNQMVLNNTTEVTQDMIDIATQEALSRTWQDNSEYTKAVLGIRNTLNKINVNGYGLGDVLIPFAKTPANLTKAIIDYSPAGLVSAITKGVKLSRSLTNGQYSAKTQHEFVESLGKAFAGTALYVLGLALANSGIISGDSDEDKDVSNFLKNTLGINSYSIKIGDKSFTYDWAQPIAAPLSIMANIVNSKDKDAALIEGIVGSLDSAGSILLEQSFLQSINDVLNNQDGVISGLITEGLELPARAVPTFLKQIADLVDGTQRQTFEYGKPVKSAFNQIITKIPGLSQTLAPSVDTLGREIQKYGGKNNLFNVFLNPANVSTENISKSGQEIYRLYKETGETNIMPRVAPYYVNKKGKKIVLDTKQRAEYQKVSGSIIENNVAKLLELTEYKNMSDKDKASVVNDIVNYSYNIAQNQVLGTELTKEYERAYEYSKIGDISDYYAFTNSVDDKNADTKRESVFNYLYNSDLEDNQIASLYSKYYSKPQTLDTMLTLQIPMRQFIKFDSADIQGEYNPKTGQTISGSKKNAVIKYVNSLEGLSKAQKAIIIKSTKQYKFDNYNNDIIRYVNTLNGSVDEKKVWLKSIGFDNYDRDVVRYIKSQGLSQEETEKKLKDLGFTIRDGRVYY